MQYGGKLRYGMGIYHRPEEGDVEGWWCWPVAVGAGKSATFRTFAVESVYAPGKGQQPEQERWH